MNLLVATGEGIHRIGDGREPTVELPGHDVTALALAPAGLVAITNRAAAWSSHGPGDWREIGDAERQRANCIAEGPAGVLVGTSEAHLLRSDGRALDPLASFDRTEDRDAWYTPWGGPPDVRSISQLEDEVFVNVHVGGIPRSADGGATWTPTIDIHADVHQVVADDTSGLVLAACARGLAVSADRGATWEMRTDGLHATYARAVAVAGDVALVSVSAGPRGGRAALYRGPLGTSGAFERCSEGLPESFSGNLDTHWVAAYGSTAAFASPEGDVYLSTDAGRTWERVAGGLAAIAAVVLEPG